MRTEAQLNAKMRSLVRSPGLWRRIEDIIGNLGTFNSYLAIGGEVGLGGAEGGRPRRVPVIRKGQPAFSRAMLREDVPVWLMVGHPDGLVCLLGGGCLGHNWRGGRLDRYDRPCHELLDCMLRNHVF